MSFFPTHSPLVLASGSPIRRHLLSNTGVKALYTSVDVDENQLRKKAHKNGLNAYQTALFLAEEKAKKATLSYSSDHIIIAADQILNFNNQIFSKPLSYEEAYQQLSTLRGETHSLHTALVLWKGEKCLWRHVSTPHLTMRLFSNQFLNYYLELEKNEIHYCVGGYRLEGPGIHLFEKYIGDYDAILGLPLTPLLKALRQYAGLLT